MKKNPFSAFCWTALIFWSCNCNHESKALVLAKPEPSKINDSLAFGDKNWISHGLQGKIYFLPEGTSRLPASFDTMHSEGIIYTKTVDVPERSWSNGFPGVSNRFEWFAIEYKGDFKPAKPGLYTFRLVSDDGSKLYIDDSLVVNNDGTHGTSSVSGSIDLSSSYHRIQLQYFQGPRFYVTLQLFAHLDKEDEQIFPGNYFQLSTPGAYPVLAWTILIIAIILVAVVLVFLRWNKRKSSR